MQVLVTGGAGFIGSDFVRYALGEHQDWHLTNLDKLTYAGNLKNLSSVETNPRYHFVKGDVCDADLVFGLFEKHKFDLVVHFAAESHVDRSIESSAVFLSTNILGTQVLLDAARKHPVKNFLQISTDEVYGSLGKTGAFSEQTPLAPNSPYSASKASADLLVRAYHETYGLPAIITRCSNNYGPFQYPEKFIPLMITNLFEDKKIPLYGDGANVRDWIYVRDHSCAVDCVLQKGKPGDVYNIGGQCEMANIDLTKQVLDIFERDESYIQYVKDRPGHDRRYAMDITKINKELGWQPQHRDFAENLRSTIAWYKDNEPWWREIRSGEYRQYYERMYGNR